MRVAIATALTVALAACSDPAPQQPGTTEATDELAPANAPAVSPSAGTLTGEISGLSGEVTPFEVTVTDRATIVDLAADVLFAFDSADLSPQAPEQLAKAADLIRKGGTGVISVVGHTDSKGDDAYNLDLSLRRARAVVAWLSSDGAVLSDRLTAEGKGETDPVAPNAGTEGNDYPEGRALNRRVQIVIPRN